MRGYDCSEAPDKLAMGWETTDEFMNFASDDVKDLVAGWQEMQQKNPRAVVSAIRQLPPDGTSVGSSGSGDH